MQLFINDRCNLRKLKLFCDYGIEEFKKIVRSISLINGGDHFLVWLLFGSAQRFN